MKYKVQNLVLICCLSVLFLGCNPKQEGLKAAIEMKNMAIVNTLLGSGLYSKTEIADAFELVLESNAFGEDEKKEFYNIFNSRGFSINDLEVNGIAQNLVEIYKLGVLEEVDGKAQDEDGRTVFHYMQSSEKGSTEKTWKNWIKVWDELVYKNKESINVKDKEGLTPLAMMFYSPSTVELVEFSILFLNGADPTISDIRGLNAIDYCEGKVKKYPESYKQHVQIIKYDYTKEQLGEMREDFINTGSYSYYTVN